MSKTPQPFNVGDKVCLRGTVVTADPHGLGVDCGGSLVSVYDGAHRPMNEIANWSLDLTDERQKVKALVEAGEVVRDNSLHKDCGAWRVENADMMALRAALADFRKATGGKK